MTLRALAITSAALLVACSSGDFRTAALPEDAAVDTATASSPDASTPDTSTPDTSTPDTATTDSSPDDAADSASPDTAVVDGGAHDECKLASDCRLFSSDCNDEGMLCVCFSLAPGKPDPACATGHGTCFVDPCLGKAAKCEAGKCTVE